MTGSGIETIARHLPSIAPVLYGYCIDQLECPIDTVTVSPKFQVVIPRAIRERLGLVPGQKLQAMVHEGRIEFVPLEPATALRGFLRGSDLRGARDKER